MDRGNLLSINICKITDMKLLNDEIPISNSSKSNDIQK